MTHLITFAKMLRITIPMGLIMGLVAGIIIRSWLGI